MTMFQGWRLGWRLVAAVLVVQVFAAVVMLVTLQRQATDAISTEKQRDFERRNAALLAGLQLVAATVEAESQTLARTLRAQVGEPRVSREGLVTADGAPIASRAAEVDALSQASGAVATVFERRGDDFVRVATSVRKADGSRAVGTALAADSPALGPLREGKGWSGRVDLFGRPFLAHYEPIVVDGRTVGAWFTGRELGPVLEALRRSVGGIKVGETGFVAIVDRDGRALAHPQHLGQLLTAAGDAPEQAAWREVLAGRRGHLSFLVGPREWTMDYDALPELGWKVAMVVPRDEVLATATMLSRVLTTVVLAAVLLQVGLVVWLLRRMVQRPLETLATELGRVRQGELDLSFRPEPAGTRDELRQLEGTLRQVFIDLRRIVGGVKEGSQALVSASRQIEAGTQDLSSRTESQAAAVEETRASAASIAEDARVASEAAGGTARQASVLRTAAEQAARQVADAVDAAQQAAVQARSITDMVAAVEQLAFQTNILSLNAAVEAARAGDQGKGFAVVAGEVRNLATRTDGAVKNIRGLAEQIDRALAQSRQNAEQAGASMTGLAAEVAGLEQGVARIAERAAGTMDAVGQTEAAVRDFDEAAQRNAALVEEAAAACTSVVEQASRLEEMVAGFRH